MTAPARLQLKIVLDHLKPTIWRRVVVNEDITFLQLHAVIQRAMGWEDCHMHEFQLASPPTAIGTPSADDFFGSDRPMLPEQKTRLADVLTDKKKFRYWYDFGDDWWHTVTIEKRLPPDVAAPAAQLLAGEFACPPKDCGGPYIYPNLLEAIADPRHPAHAELLDWLGEFDPEEFNLADHAKWVSGCIRAKKSKAAKPSAG
jgi:hypothetical protein